MGGTLSITMQVDLDGTTLELTRGDIARQDDVDAVVNAANAQLRTGGGVAGAIHRAAGEGLAEECRSYAPIEPGQAVTTSAHDLPNAHVVHCLGPRYGKDEPADELLAACYVNALDECQRHGIGSVAFPAISTGAFGYPIEEAARVALEETMWDELPTRKLGLVRFVLYGKEALDVHLRVLDGLTEGGG